MIESQYASGFIDFNTTGANNSPAVANIADLQRTVDDLGKVEYDLNIHEPFIIVLTVIVVKLRLVEQHKVII